MPDEDEAERQRRVEEAHAFRDWEGQPTVLCRECHVWSAIGPPWAQAFQFQTHWLSCPGVASLSFHPDGSLASVAFRR